MIIELQGPKEEIIKRYYRFIGYEHYEDVKVIVPLEQMLNSNCGYWRMVVETIPVSNFTSRGIFG